MEKLIRRLVKDGKNFKSLHYKVIHTFTTVYLKTYHLRFYINKTFLQFCNRQLAASMHYYLNPRKRKYDIFLL